MRYDYISLEGNIIERSFSIHTVPSEITEDGITYCRYHGNMAHVIYQASGFKSTDTADAVTKWQREYLNKY